MEDIHLATTFGHQVALVLENIELRGQAEQAAILRERNRLARDLHDSVTQSLYSLTVLAEAGRRLAHYGELCGVPVTAHRLRHTFASQMLTVGMPVTSLQRFLGHEHLDTTMIYAEVADTVLEQDYYRGISVLDSVSEKMVHKNWNAVQQDSLRQLVLELKGKSLAPHRRDEILNQMQCLLEDQIDATGE